MEKLLRILFVMCAIAFVTTVTACADDDKTAKTPSIFKFEAAPKGVTIDDSKDVYKITINPSLLAYVDPSGGVGAAVAAMKPAPIFTVAFTDDKQGFIIPTTADKAEALSTKHVADLAAAGAIDIGAVAPSDVTHSFLADAAADAPVFGFSATEINEEWSTLAPLAAVGGTDAVVGVEGIMTDTKVRVSCKTTITGINKDSFTVIAPASDDDVAIAEGTKTVCAFSLVSDGADPTAQKTAYKAWATAAVELAKDDATKNIQKMSFVGIVTGDDTASAITKAAGITEDDNTLGVKGFTAATSAKLVKAYKTSLPSLQKVEIVIAVAK